MVAYCVTKMMTMCSPLIVQFFDTMIVASNDKQLETILNPNPNPNLNPKATIIGSIIVTTSTQMDVQMKFSERRWYDHYTHHVPSSPIVRYKIAKCKALESENKPSLYKK